MFRSYHHPGNCFAGVIFSDFIFYGFILAQTLFNRITQLSNNNATAESSKQTLRLKELRSQLHLTQYEMTKWARPPLLPSSSPPPPPHAALAWGSSSLQPALTSAFTPSSDSGKINCSGGGFIMWRCPSLLKVMMTCPLVKVLRDYYLWTNCWANYVTDISHGK